MPPPPPTRRWRCARADLSSFSTHPLGLRTAFGAPFFWPCPRFRTDSRLPGGAPAGALAHPRRTHLPQGDPPTGSGGPLRGGEAPVPDGGAARLPRSPGNTTAREKAPAPVSGGLPLYKRPGVPGDKASAPGSMAGAPHMPGAPHMAEAVRPTVCGTAAARRSRQTAPPRQVRRRLSGGRPRNPLRLSAGAVPRRKTFPQGNVFCVVFAKKLSKKAMAAGKTRKN